MSLLRGPEPSGLVHQALLFRTPEEFAAVVSDYVREGIARQDVVIVAALPRNLDALRASLTAAESAAVTLGRSVDGYSHPGRALTGYQDVLAAHAGSGRGLRMVGQQPLTELHPDHVRELCRIDAAFNEVCAAPRVSVVCPYDVTALPRQVIDQVRCSHPVVVQDGASSDSPQYRAPAELLGRERSGPPLSVPGGRLRELVRPSHPAEVRAFVIDSARQLGVPAQALDDLLVAVNEAVTNAFVHALMDRVRVWAEHDRLVCEVQDRGPGITDPLVGYRQPGVGDGSARGLWIAHQLADLVEVRTGPRGTTVRLHLFTGAASSVPAVAEPPGGEGTVDDLRSGWLARPAPDLLDTVRSIGAPAVLVGRDGAVHAANAAASTLFGLDQPDGAGRPAARLWASVNDRDGRPLDEPPSSRTLSTGDRVDHLELLVSDAAGNDVPVLVSAAPVFRPGLVDPAAALVVFRPVGSDPDTGVGDLGRHVRGRRAKQVRRGAFEEQVAEALARRPAGPVAVMRIDVDVLGKGGSPRGSAVTDAALAIVGRRIQRAVRPQDVFTRLARDRFAVLVSDDGGPAALTGIADRVRRAVARPVRLDETDVLVQVRAHVSVHRDADAVRVLRPGVRSPSHAPPE